MRVYRFAGGVLTAAVAVTLCSASEPVRGWVEQMQSANSLVEAGDLNNAEVIYQSALAEAESAGDDLRAAVALQNLGKLLYRRGHTLEAEKAYLRGIKALTQSPVADDKLFVRTSLGLSVLYVQTGQHAKAESLIRGLLTAYPGAADSDKASLMGNLGVILARKQSYDEAEQVLRHTAKLSEGSSDPDLQEAGAVAIANIAEIQRRGGAADEALQSYRHALGILEALPHPSPVTLALILGEYAGVLSVTGHRDTADGLYRKAIAVAKARLGENHLVLGALFNEYARLLREEGRKSEARNLENAAQRIREESERENLTGHAVSIEVLAEEGIRR